MQSPDGMLRADLMLQKLPLSCFIIAKNESDRIVPTIRAVRDWVDEVLVIDSGSEDGTQELATREGARVVFNAWPGFGQQKRFGEMLCRNNWLLNLDADEVVSGPLAQEIQDLFRTGEPKNAAYYLRVDDVYPGQQKPRLWAHDYLVVRLYDRRVVRFKDSAIHDSVDISGVRSGVLGKPVFHFSTRSFSDALHKAIERSGYNAAHAKLKSGAFLKVRLLLEFPISFLRYYLLRRHFMGGLAGFQMAMIGAIGRYARLMAMLEESDRRGRKAQQ